ncbi:hypothetical protein MASR2M117_09140 [Paludibacter sp.]
MTIGLTDVFINRQRFDPKSLTLTLIDFGNSSLKDISRGKSTYFIGISTDNSRSLLRAFTNQKEADINKKPMKLKTSFVDKNDLSFKNNFLI